MYIHRYPESSKPSSAGPMGTDGAAADTPLHFLADGPPVSQLFFYHMFLDTHLANSGVSALPRSEVIDFLLQALTQLKPLFPADMTKRLDLIIHLLNKATNYMNIFDPEDSATAICTALRNLEEGESLCIFAGWQTPGSGHTLPFLYTKKGETFDIKIYNSGGGLYYYDFCTDYTKVKYNPILFFKSVPAALIVGEIVNEPSPFMLAIEYCAKVTQPESFGMENFFEGPIFCYLSSYKSALENPYYITPQRGPTCNWQGTLEFLRGELGDAQAFKRLKSYLRLLALHSLKDLSLPPSAQDEACSVFCREIEKKHRANILSYEEAEMMRKVASSMRPPPDQLVIKRPIEQGSLVLEGLNPYSKVVNFSDIPVNKGDSSPNRKETSHCSLNSDFQDGPDLLQQILAVQLRFLQLCNEGEARELGLQVIKSFVLKIPLKSDYWNQLDKPQEVVKCLTELLFSFYQNTWQFSKVYTFSEYFTSQLLYIHIFEMCKRIEATYLQDIAPKTFEDEFHFYAQISSKDDHDKYREYCEYLSQYSNAEYPFICTSRGFCTFEIQSTFYPHEFYLFDRILTRTNSLDEPLDKSASDAFKNDRFRLNSEQCARVCLMSLAPKDCYPASFQWLFYLQRAAFLLRSLDCTPGTLQPDQLSLDKDTLPRELAARSWGVQITEPHIFNIDRVPKKFEYNWPDQLPIASEDHLKFLIRNGEEILSGHASQEGEAYAMQLHSDAQSWFSKECARVSTQSKLKYELLLTTFAGNEPTFSKLENQTVFWLTFFDPQAQSTTHHALQQSIGKNPHLITLAVNFIQQGIEHFESQPSIFEKGKIESILFFVVPVHGVVLSEN